MTFESSDKQIQKHITFNNVYWTLVVLIARKLLVSGTSYVSSAGCRFFASRFLRLKNESRSVARKATNPTIQTKQKIEWRAKPQKIEFSGMNQQSCSELLLTRVAFYRRIVY